jgi:hypothetical protein
MTMVLQIIFSVASDPLLCENKSIPRPSTFMSKDMNVGTKFNFSSLIILLYWLKTLCSTESSLYFEIYDILGEWCSNISTLLPI